MAWRPKLLSITYKDASGKTNTMPGAANARKLRISKHSKFLQNKTFSNPEWKTKPNQTQSSWKKKEEQSCFSGRETLVKRARTAEPCTGLRTLLTALPGLYVELPDALPLQPIPLLTRPRLADPHTKLLSTPSPGGNSSDTEACAAVACLLPVTEQMHGGTSPGTRFQACPRLPRLPAAAPRSSGAPEVGAYLNLVRCVNCSCPWTGHWFWDWR